MSMTQRTNQVVVDFLIGEIDPGFLQAYEILASLHYPIADYRSFTGQISSQAEAAGEEENAIKSGASELVTTIFGIHDFPVPSVQGALERFHASLVPPPDFEVDTNIPRSKSRPVGPAPGQKTEICWQEWERNYSGCLADKILSTDFCATLAWQRYVRCIAAWRGYSLPFARGGLRPETFVSRPPKDPLFLDDSAY